MIKYYRETNGDYICADFSPEMTRYEGAPICAIVHEGRAAAIAGLVTSVCTTGISEDYIETCETVPKKNVPALWLRWLKGGS